MRRCDTSAFMQSLSADSSPVGCGSCTTGETAGAGVTTDSIMLGVMVDGWVKVVLGLGVRGGNTGTSPPSTLATSGWPMTYMLVGGEPAALVLATSCSLAACRVSQFLPERFYENLIN